MKTLIKNPMFWLGIAVAAIAVYLVVRDSKVSVTVATAPAAPVAPIASPAPAVAVV